MRRPLLLVSVLALGLAWFARARAPEDPAASLVVDACRDSLAWRIGEVDPRFGVSRDGLERTVADAARLWNEAAGRRVLVRGGEDAVPIDLVYDRRQVETKRRRSAREHLSELEREVERLAAENRRRVRDYEWARDALARRGEALERRVAEHNAEVARWNRRGAAPPHVAERLERASRAIDAEMREVERAAHELERLRQDANAAAERGNRTAQRLNAAVDRYDRDNAGRSVKSGGYQARVRRDGWGRVTVTRGITVYQFDDARDLARVLAHELGHALGIEHVAEPGAIMHARQEVSNAARPAELHAADIAALRGLCQEGE